MGPTYAFWLRLLFRQLAFQQLRVAEFLEFGWPSYTPIIFCWTIRYDRTHWWLQSYDRFGGTGSESAGVDVQVRRIWRINIAGLFKYQAKQSKNRKICVWYAITVYLYKNETALMCTLVVSCKLVLVKWSRIISNW